MPPLVGGKVGWNVGLSVTAAVGCGFLGVDGLGVLAYVVATVGCGFLGVVGLGVSSVGGNVGWKVGLGVPPLVGGNVGWNVGLGVPLRVVGLLLGGGGTK